MPHSVHLQSDSIVLLVHINGGHGVDLAHALKEDGEFRGQRGHRWRTCSLFEEQLTLLSYNIEVLLQLVQLCCLLLQSTVYRTRIKVTVVC